MESQSCRWILSGNPVRVAPQAVSVPIGAIVSCRYESSQRALDTCVIYASADANKAIGQTNLRISELGFALDGIYMIDF